MKNRLSSFNLPGVVKTPKLGARAEMSAPLMQFVDQLVGSARRAVQEQGTDLCLVCVARNTTKHTENGFNCHPWRTAKGLQGRVEELRKTLAETQDDVLCVVGPHGPHGEQNWFVYAEDQSGCWFSLLPIGNSTYGEPTFGEPAFRPANPEDGFYQVLPSPLS